MSQSKIDQKDFTCQKLCYTISFFLVISREREKSFGKKQRRPINIPYSCPAKVISRHEKSGIFKLFKRNDRTKMGREKDVEMKSAMMTSKDHW